MAIAEDIPTLRSHGAGGILISEAADKASDGVALPSIEELFSDPEVRRRVGHVIANAVRRTSSPKS